MTPRCSDEALEDGDAVLQAPSGFELRLKIWIKSKSPAQRGHVPEGNVTPVGGGGGVRVAAKEEEELGDVQP